MKGVKLINGKLKGGAVFPFRPLFTGISHQLKRGTLWNNLEVHVIYALVYLLCTNKNGLSEFKMYLAARDPQVFDPHFIAQYLLVPINTIVKFYLLPWMMEPHYKMRKDNSVAIRNQFRTRCTKAGIFLKYTLLLDLMKIVIDYGRNPGYNFKKDKDLAKIVEYKYGIEGKGSKNQVTLAFDGFLTIWLCTLPEKF